MRMIHTSTLWPSEFEKFLQERGINESLAAFIPEFAEFKEQKVRVRVPRHEIT